MEQNDYRFEGMTIAVTNIDGMVDFYSHVFGIQFKASEMGGAKFYSGTWGGLNLLFCPAEIAGNTAKQNRLQYDIIVADIQKTIELATAHGGTTMGEMAENNAFKMISVYDPDGNSMVFKELKK